MRQLEHFLIAALFQKRSDITVCIHPTPAISLLRHTMLSIHNDDNNLLSQKISKTINSTTSTLLHIRTTSSIGWRQVILGCRLQPAGRTFVVRCYSASVLLCCHLFSFCFSFPHHPVLSHQLLYGLNHPPRTENQCGTSYNTIPLQNARRRASHCQAGYTIGQHTFLSIRPSVRDLRCGRCTSKPCRASFPTL